MEADDIERYLAELGAELKNRGIKKPVRILLIGGAYMLLLANAPRSTKDIDIFWLDEDGLQQVYTPLSKFIPHYVRASRLSSKNTTSMPIGLTISHRYLYTMK